MFSTVATRIGQTTQIISGLLSFLCEEKIRENLGKKLDQARLATVYFIVRIVFLGLPKSNVQFHALVLKQNVESWPTIAELTWISYLLWKIGLH